MKTFREYFGETLQEEKFDINKFIAACKKQKAAFDKSGNSEGSKFLDGVLKSYDKNGSLSPDQVSAASKFMEGTKFEGEYLTEK